MTHFTDRMFFDANLKQTADGWVTQARVARGGNVQTYLGSEMGMADRATVRVYRPEAEVFDRKAFATYARKPIVISHPAGGVTPDNWKDLAVGEIDRDVVRDGEFVSVPLLFRDVKAVSLVTGDGGPRELSMGYDAVITMQDGVTPKGEAYDAMMSDFRMNHVAIVGQARGGAELRIGDGASAGWGASPIVSDGKVPTMADAISTRTVLIDGISVVTTDQGAQALEKLTRQLADAKVAADKALADAKADHVKVVADKDEAIGKLKADLKTAQDGAITPDKLTKLIADRVALEGAVKAVAPSVVTDGKADAEIRKAAVAAKLGDDMVKDASDAEIVGMFRAIAKDAKPADAVADALKNGVKTINGASTVEDEAYAKSVSDMNAWRNQKTA